MISRIFDYFSFISKNPNMKQDSLNELEKIVKNNQKDSLEQIKIEIPKYNFSDSEAVLKIDDLTTLTDTVYPTITIYNTSIITTTSTNVNQITETQTFTETGYSSLSSTITDTQTFVETIYSTIFTCGTSSNINNLKNLSTKSNVNTEFLKEHEIELIELHKKQTELIKKLILIHNISIPQEESKRIESFNKLQIEQLSSYHNYLINNPMNNQQLIKSLKTFNEKQLKLYDMFHIFQLTHHKYSEITLHQKEVLTEFIQPLRLKLLQELQSKQLENLKSTI